MSLSRASASDLRGPCRAAPALLAILILLVLTACGGSRRADAEFAALYVGGSSGAAAPGGTVPGAVSGSPGVTGGVSAGGVGVAAPGGSTTGPVGGTAPGAAAGAAVGPAAAHQSGGTAATGGAHGPGAATAASTPIRLASIGVLSGPIGGALIGGETAVQAWAAATNAAGGINGHPIQLYVADDGSDPAKHSALVHQMVEENHVVAFLHNIDVFSGQAVVPYLEQQHIPVVGGAGGSPWFNTSPAYFPQMPSDTFLADTFAGEMATVGKPQGMNKIAVAYCAEVQGCYNATRPEAFQKAGLDLVYSAKVSLGQPDYTAQCLSARNAGAQMFFLALDGQGNQRLADDCATIGYKPLYGHTAQATVTAELSRPSLEGAVVGSPTVPWFQNSIPAVAEFSATMAKYAPGVVPGGSAMQGWTSAKLMEAALRATTDPTTSSGILRGLYSIHGNDLGGLTFPITYRQGAPNNGGTEAGCWWVVRVQGGRFVSPDNGQRHCA
jgi:branched-chain amino acid transport system substrate-binding protein